MANLPAGTIKVDWGDLKRALKALGWEGASVLYAIPVRGGIEIATRYGVEVYLEPVKRKSRAKKKTGA